MAEMELVEHVNGHLTRAAMEKAINDGGSVRFRNTIITRIEDLPAEETIFEDNAAELEAHEAELAAQRLELDARIAKARKAKETALERATRPPVKEESKLSEVTPMDNVQRPFSIEDIQAKQKKAADDTFKPSPEKPVHKVTQAHSKKNAE